MLSFSIFNEKNILIFFIKIQYIPIVTCRIGKRKWYETGDRHRLARGQKNPRPENPAGD